MIKMSRISAETKLGVTISFSPSLSISSQLPHASSRTETFIALSNHKVNRLCVTKFPLLTSGLLQQHFGDKRSPSRSRELRVRTL